MRILINDFGGYPFPVQLSKQLAKEGHQVLHTYISNIATPHGNMTNDGIENLTVQPVVLQTNFKKYSIIGRLKGERAFADAVQKIIKDFKPDVFISANTPMFAQERLLKACHNLNIKFIYWCQDIHSIAIKAYLGKKIPVLGNLAAYYIKLKEIRLLKQSDHVINIAQSFSDIFEGWGIAGAHQTVIHNWAPINEITQQPKQNPWSVQHHLQDKFVVAYSGTLGLKHNPQLIADVAAHFSDNPNIVFLVLSEGIGADLLAKQGLSNLMVLPYQDYAQLPNVLGAADVLFSILEPTASLFSVPSKVLTYLCAGKPILLSVPADNLIATIVKGQQAGLCIEPGDKEAFISSINNLLGNQGLRIEMGQNGRRFAESNFEITHIADRFTKIITAVVKNGR